MKEKASGGLGSQVKQVQVITYTDEDYLWSNGYLGMTNLEQLVHIVLFIIRLHCALRAGGEHKSLHSIGFHSQFKYVFPNSGPRHIIYTRFGHKNQQRWTYVQENMPEISQIFPNEENHDYYPV